MNSWMIKETEWGRWYPSMTATEINPDFSKIISTEADLPKPHDKGWLPHWSLDLSPVICSIHSDIPGNMGVVSILLIFLESFICSRKVTRSGLETQVLFIRKRRFISFHSNMYSGEKTRCGRILTQPRKLISPNTLLKTPINTNKNIKNRSWDSGLVLLGKS